MMIFLVSLAAIVLMMLLMAVGVLAGREPLKGTCGGLNRFTGDKECPVCGGDNSKCESQQTPAAYDAMKGKD
jgi:hypothetical protein